MHSAPSQARPGSGPRDRSGRGAVCPAPAQLRLGPAHPHPLFPSLPPAQCRARPPAGDLPCSIFSLLFTTQTLGAPAGASDTGCQESSDGQVLKQAHLTSICHSGAAVLVSGSFRRPRRLHRPAFGQNIEALRSLGTCTQSVQYAPLPASWLQLPRAHDAAHDLCRLCQATGTVYCQPSLFVTTMLTHGCNSPYPQHFRLPCSETKVHVLIGVV